MFRATLTIRRICCGTLAAAGMLAGVFVGPAECFAENRIDAPTSARNSVPNFRNDILPILTKSGCNSGECHGSADGQAGFKLSLLGFEPDVDYATITQRAPVSRISRDNPSQSLLIQKAFGELGHGGGVVIEPDSRHAQSLLDWIAAGTPRPPTDTPHVLKIELTPTVRTLAMNSEQPLRVTASFSDGSTRDVTALSQFECADGHLVAVSDNGVVSTFDRVGVGSVMARYQAQIDTFRAMIPSNASAWSDPTWAGDHVIDTHVSAQLKRLRLQPSAVCSDSEFLRRVSLDITATLPTAEEVRHFLADTNPRKRDRLVTDLLSRPEYAQYFAMKWADILRVRGGTRRNAGKQAAVDEETGKIVPPPPETIADRADAFHAWIAKSLQDNKPYDEFVREILLVTGSTDGHETHPAMMWYLELKTPEQLVDDFAQVFLGTRIQCARCHHHPAERWDQSDYWGLAGFFGHLEWRAFNKNGDLVHVRRDKIARIGQVLAVSDAGDWKTSDGDPLPAPKLLDGPRPALSPSMDARRPLVDWLTDRDDPRLARAVVNRYWEHFLGRGLVDPVDDFRESNPPANPELLNALTRDFVDHGYDLKHLVHTICTSKTYQLSRTPNATNLLDHRYHSRFLPRRLQAEVLLDAVDHFLDTQTEYSVPGGYVYPQGTRAIDLPGSYIRSYFLGVFGRPERTSGCSCERENAVTLPQRLHMLNSSNIAHKIQSRAEELADDPRPTSLIVADVYLHAFARLPTEAEVQAIVHNFTSTNAPRTRPRASRRTPTRRSAQSSRVEQLEALIALTRERVVSEDHPALIELREKLEVAVAERGGPTETAGEPTAVSSTLARAPQPIDRNSAQQSAGPSASNYYDLLWALVNTKEFQFNH